MKRKLVLKNGWKLINDNPPPEGSQVLATNNPTARDAHGGMSHIWITYVIKSDDGSFVGFDSRDTKIHNLVAWHSLPRVAT